MSIITQPFTFTTVISLKKGVQKKILLFDEARSYALATVMIDAWRARQGQEPPETRFRPPSVQVGSREHANLLFAFAVASRSGMTAEKALGTCGTLAENHPGIFDPLVPWQDSFATHLEKALPFANSDPKRLDDFRNARLLCEQKYQGDARNIFLSNIQEISLHSIEGQRRKLIARWAEFPGIGSKIAQLAICWFQSVEWPDNQEEWHLIKKIPAMAVDIWWCRQVFQFGLVTEFSSDMRDFLEPRISEYFSLLCHRWKLDWRDLAQVMWHNGAENCALIKSDAESLRKNRSRCLNCPAHNFCGGRVPFLGGGTLLKVQGRKVMPHSEERIFRRSSGWSTILARAIFPETQWEPFRSFRVVQHVSVDTETYEMVREMFPGRQPIRLNYQELELLRGVLPVQHLPYRPTVQPEETGLFALHQDSL